MGGNLGKRKSSITNSETTTFNVLLDPRSPNPHRTGISTLDLKNNLLMARDLTNIDKISNTIVTSQNKLKNKLYRDMGYSIDPRSPATNFDRTPLTFLDPDITEDSLFTIENIPDISKQIEKFDNSLSEYHSTPVKFAETEIDGRSHSINMKRTPLQLYFLDVTNEEEDFKSSIDEIMTDGKVEEKNFKANIDIDYVKNEKPNINVDEKAETQISQKIESTVMTGRAKHFIYTDREDQQCTPIKISDKLGKVDNPRTPLSCLNNTKAAASRIAMGVNGENKTYLTRSIFKKSALKDNLKPNTSNSASKIPVLQRLSY